MSEPLSLDLQGVSVAFRGVPVLEDVDLQLPPRSYLALIGPNGAGKSVLLKLILGLLRPDRGHVQVLGTTPVGARGRVGYVPQHPGFDRDFPIRVREVVRMGRLPARGPLRRFREEDHVQVQVLLERLEIAHLGARPIGALSGGELQRVLIARALAMEPELLLLDEPTASLDERIGPGLYELFEELSREISVVLVSHDIGAIARQVRSVACLNRRLHAHPSGELDAELLERTYGCPVDLIAHGHPHRVLGEHPGGNPDEGEPR